MTFNYLKLAVRLLLRNPFFTTLNVLGLAMGFASFFGLWIYAVTELKSDRYHVDHERIGRVVTDWSWTDNNVTWGHMIIQNSPSPPIQSISDDLPGIESFVRMQKAEILLSLPGSDEVYREAHAVYADRTLFNFFTVPLEAGKAKTVLEAPHSIVLSRKAARKIFGNEDPLSKTLLLNGTQTLTVTGVFQDLPHNTHLDFEVVLSNQSFLNDWNTNIHNWSMNYIKLTGPALSEFEKKVNSNIDKYWGELFRAYPSVKAKMRILPLADAAFVASPDYWNFQMKSKAGLEAMAAIGLVVLVMSWINYINLTVSRTAKRMKEVATRKISGAGTAEFIKQFLMESIVANVMAVVLALTLLQLCRPWLDVYLGIHIAGWDQIGTGILVFLAMVILLGVLITGLYPAAIALNTNPIDLFLSSSKRTGNRMLPSFLTISQYTFAVALIFCAFVVHHQLDFIFNKDLGFDKRDAFFVNPALKRTERHTQELQNLRDQILRQTSVREALVTSQLINLSIFKDPASEFIKLDGVVTEAGFVSFFKHKLVAGRNFVSGDRPDVVVLTEHAAERLGYSPSGAVGRKVYVGDNKEEKEIIGVIESFRLNPFLKTESTETNTGRGMVLIYRTPEQSNANVLILKVGRDRKDEILKIEKMYRKFFPGNAFSGFYFEDILLNPYNSERTLRSQVSFFTLLAVGIACLGLLGNVANKVVGKTREIGIRKALGAGAGNIADVLLRSVVYHISVAIAFGLTLAYALSEWYLERYTDRITFTVWHFGIPVLLLAGIMALTISTLLFRANNINPVETLRHE